MNLATASVQETRSLDGNEVNQLKKKPAYVFRKAEHTQRPPRRRPQPTSTDSGNTDGAEVASSPVDNSTVYTVPGLEDTSAINDAVSSFGTVSESNQLDSNASVDFPDSPPVESSVPKEYPLSESDSEPKAGIAENVAALSLDPTNTNQASSVLVPHANAEAQGTVLPATIVSADAYNSEEALVLDDDCERWLHISHYSDNERLYAERLSIELAKYLSKAKTAVLIAACLFWRLEQNSLFRMVDATCSSMVEYAKKHHSIGRSSYFNYKRLADRYLARNSYGEPIPKLKAEYTSYPLKKLYQMQRRQSQQSRDGAKELTKSFETVEDLMRWQNKEENKDIHIMAISISYMVEKT